MTADRPGASFYFGRAARTTLSFLLSAWLFLFALLFVFQRRLLYVPQGENLSPAAVGLTTVAAQTLPTPDGARLTFWTAPARPGQPTILYFHGNGGTLAHRHVNFRRFIDAGYGLAAMSYRGFSGSTGSPTEPANIADAVHTYDELRRRGIAAEDIILFGESLGSGVAVQMAAARRVAAVVLESPYSSIADVAADRYWFMPVRLALRDHYDSVTHVKRVTAPILILAGTTDTIVPVGFSRKLAAAIPGVKKYVEYPRAWHVNTFDYGGFDDVRAWVTLHHRPTR